MRRFLLKNASLYTANLLHHSSSTTAPLAVSSHSRFRLFSSYDKPAPLPSTTEKPVPAPSIKDYTPIEIEDVHNIGKHEDTDDELIDELRPKPIDDVNDEDFEEDFEEIHETDEEIDDLYDARDLVIKRMVKAKY